MGYVPGKGGKRMARKPRKMSAEHMAAEVKSCDGKMRGVRTVKMRQFCC
jgi:hypothetical protein